MSQAACLLVSTKKADLKRARALGITTCLRKARACFFCAVAYASYVSDGNGPFFNVRRN